MLVSAVDAARGCPFCVDDGDIEVFTFLYLSTVRHGETRKAFDVASDGIGGDMRVTSHGLGARAVWPTRRGAQARASCYEADEDDGQALDLREESGTADVLMRR